MTSGQLWEGWQWKPDGIRGLAFLRIVILLLDTCTYLNLVKLLQHNVTECLHLLLGSTIACGSERANLLSSLSSLMDKGVLSLELVDLLSRVGENIGSQILR